MSNMGFGGPNTFNTTQHVRFAHNPTTPATKQDSGIDHYIKSLEGTNKKSKKGFLLNPLTILGGITGGALGVGVSSSKRELDRFRHEQDMIGEAKRQQRIQDEIQKERQRQSEMQMLELKEQQEEAMNTMDIVLPAEEQYHKISNNVIKDSRVIFDKGAATIVFNHNGVDQVLDTITRDEMPEIFDIAYEEKNEELFKKALKNQMDFNFYKAEYDMAKELGRKHKDTFGEINKLAGIAQKDYSDNMTPLEVGHALNDINKKFSTPGEALEKVAFFVENEMSDYETFVFTKVAAELQRPLNMYTENIVDDVKESSVTDYTNIGLNEIEKLKSSDYMIEHADIVFTPEYAVTKLDGNIVDIVSIDELDEDGAVAFVNHDRDYFIARTVEQVRIGFARLTEGNSIPMEKKAEEDKMEVKEIFLRADINPVVYYLVLTNELSDEWLEFDTFALVKIIEDRFNLTEPIHDSALNKILSVQVANNSEITYTSKHAFEKVIRSFNGLPIDFEVRESDDLELKHFVHGLDVMNRVTPFDNIYDNFSPEVYKYMVDTLADKEVYLWGVRITAKSDTEANFISIINRSLINEINRRFLSKVHTPEEEQKIIDDNEIIFANSLLILETFKSHYGENFPRIGDILEEELKATSIPNDLAPLIANQVVVNLSLQNALSIEEDKLINQLKKLQMTE